MHNTHKISIPHSTSASPPSLSPVLGKGLLDAPPGFEVLATLGVDRLAGLGEREDLVYEARGNDNHSIDIGDDNVERVDRRRGKGGGVERADRDRNLDLRRAREGRLAEG